MSLIKKLCREDDAAGDYRAGFAAGFSRWRVGEPTIIEVSDPREADYIYRLLHHIGETVNERLGLKPVAVKDALHAFLRIYTPLLEQRREDALAVFTQRVFALLLGHAPPPDMWRLSPIKATEANVVSASYLKSFLSREHTEGEGKIDRKALDENAAMWRIIFDVALLLPRVPAVEEGATRIRLGESATVELDTERVVFTRPFPSEETLD